MDRKIDALRNIEMLKEATNIEKMTKGFSSAEKYVALVKGIPIIVRIGESKLFKRKQEEYHILERVSELGIKVTKPLELGEFKIEENTFYYFITSYIDGQDVKTERECLSEDELYDLGIEAGKILKKMHTLNAPKDTKSWYDYAVNKHERYIEAYKKCGVTIDGDEKVLAFIEENKHLLKDRPNQFQHDDFHLENLIVQNKKLAGVIDFEKFDWGDPYHDFVKLAMFQRNESIDFAVGQIQGYFDGNISDDFWLLYCVYCAMVILSAIVWTVRDAPDDLDNMLVRLNTILEDHEYFERVKPAWFEKFDH